MSTRKHLAMVTLFTFLIQLTPIGLIPAYAGTPTVTSIFAGDANSDDTMDRIVLTFSEDISGTITPTNFTSEGYGCSISSVSQTSSKILTFIMAGCTSGTNVRVTLKYIPGDLKSVSTNDSVAGFAL